MNKGCDSGFHQSGEVAVHALVPIFHSLYRPRHIAMHMSSSIKLLNELVQLCDCQFSCVLLIFNDVFPPCNKCEQLCGLSFGQWPIVVISRRVSEPSQAEERCIPSEDDKTYRD